MASQEEKIPFKKQKNYVNYVNKPTLKFFEPEYESFVVETSLEYEILIAEEQA